MQWNTLHIIDWLTCVYLGNQHQPGSNGLVNIEEIGGDNSKVHMEPDSTEDHEGDVICCAFRHQVGGHKCVLQVTENLICKPCEESERIFYNNVPAILQPYVPGYRGMFWLLLMLNYTYISHIYNINAYQTFIVVVYDNNKHTRQHCWPLKIKLFIFSD